MNFKQAETQFKLLEAKFAAGTLSKTEFLTQLEKLMVQDDKGSWWVIGNETKQWHRYNGKEWVQANPYRSSPNYGAFASVAVVIFVLFGIWGIVSSSTSRNFRHFIISS